ncbi:MAG TPA: hypothetical protein VMN78_00390 [Longimicrobiales bacterium]|nr:hypothetical protein [Longimicrobiales bacterium]
MFIYLVFFFLVGAAAFAVAAPRVSPAAAKSYAAAGVSPAWFLLATAIVLIPGVELEHDRHAYVAAGILIVPAAWLVYRHRRWPWAALLISVAVISAAIVAMFIKAVSGGLIG